MAKKATTKPMTPDRHKPSKMVRIKPTLAQCIEALAIRNASDATAEINRAVRELLEREGLWPPKPA